MTVDEPLGARVVPEPDGKFRVTFDRSRLPNGKVPMTMEEAEVLAGNILSVLAEHQED